jgi:hypothetical protein
MNRRSIQSVITAALLVAGSLWTNLALADWDPTTPNTKWVQLPDRSPTGMDVLATFSPNGEPGTILADDFLCTFSGPITDVHIWGSWRNEILPRTITPTGSFPDPAAVRFKLSFHNDIPDPDGPTGPGYSRPGALLWQRIVEPGEFVVREDGIGQELFFNPRTNQITGSDSTIYQYNFFIPKAEAFEQQQGNIYWLDVQAMVGGDGSGSGFADFGWKTSLQHFNDDAVHGNTPFPGNPGFWDELRYPNGSIPPQQFHPGFPNGHPLAGQSIDLAFALTTIPEPNAIALLALSSMALQWRPKRHAPE